MHRRIDPTPTLRPTQLLTSRPRPIDIAQQISRFTGIEGGGGLPTQHNLINQLTIVQHTKPPAVPAFSPF